jgi:hypothetical protein
MAFANGCRQMASQLRLLSRLFGDVDRLGRLWERRKPLLAGTMRERIRRERMRILPCAMRCFGPSGKRPDAR